MEYVSLDQTDINDQNSNNCSSSNISNMPEKSTVISNLNFENIKSHIKNKAKKGKKKISKFRRELYKKQVNCQNRASLIVHMVTNSPKDPKNLIFFSLILSGVGFLFPYNCLINAADYFQLKYCNNHLIYSISVAYVLAAVTTVSLNNLIVQSVHFIRRIIFGYVLAITVMLLLTIVIIWFHVLSKEASYYWIVVATIITAVGCSIQQSSFYGYSSLLPRRYTQALMIGESLSGVLASAFRISTFMLLDRTPTVYFFLCVGQMFICLIIFHISVRSGFVQHHLHRHQHNVLNVNSNSLIKSTHSLSYQINTPNSNSFNNNIHSNVSIHNNWTKTVSMEINNPAYAIEEDHLPQNEPPYLESSDDDEIEEAFDNDLESSDVDQSENSFSHLRKSSHTSKAIMINSRSTNQSNSAVINFLSNVKDGLKFRLQICKLIWPHMIAMFLAYFVTLSVFPGVVTDIESRKWKETFPLFVMLVFNISDFIGKICTSIFRKTKGICLFICSLSRILLIPLIIICIIPHNAPVIYGDFWVLFLISILGLSNGYFGCQPMLQAPQIVKDNQKEVSGNLMTTAYSLGLSMGVLSALQIKYTLIIPNNKPNLTVHSIVNLTFDRC
uniref:Slc29a-2 n=1 Tax=Schmidtea mediterranea TaxID=79327 RepID=A0A0H3YF77_SCHMD|nr:slc29a-2 [Schmidtea mediterranea]